MFKISLIALIAALGQTVSIEKKFNPRPVYTTREVEALAEVEAAQPSRYSHITYPSLPKLAEVEADRTPRNGNDTPRVLAEVEGFGQLGKALKTYFNPPVK